MGAGSTSRSIEAIEAIEGGRSSRARLLRAAVLTAVLGPLTCSGIHEDELRCEEAVARLQRCCPGFDAASIDCRHSALCGNTSSRPQLSMEQSACLLDRGCEELDRGAEADSCARARRPVPDAMNGGLLLCP